MTLLITPRRVGRSLAMLVGLTVLVGTVAEYVRQATASWTHHGLTELAGKFVLDAELSVPAWLSSLGLACCGLLLGLIALSQHRARSHFAWHWTGLAVIFVALSCDEMVAMHEMLVQPLQRYLGASGLFHSAWVIAGAALIATLGICYLRFVFVHLDRAARWRFILAGACYVSGALVMEMIEGPIDVRFGTESVPAQAAVVVEEAMEMVGIALFIHALLLYIAQHVGDLRISIDTGASIVPDQVEQEEIGVWTGSEMSSEDWLRARVKIN